MRVSKYPSATLKGEQQLTIRARRGTHRTSAQYHLITGLFLLGAVLLMAASGQACSGSSLPVSALDLIPKDASSVVIRDMQLILKEAPREYRDEVEDVSSDYFDHIGVSLDDVTTIVEAQIGGETLVVLEGELDIDRVRDRLDDAAHDDEVYRGYEMWSVQIGFQRRWWALIEDRVQLVSGSTEVIKSALRTLDRGSGSILDDPDNEIARVLKKAGHGWTTIAETECDTLGVRSCLATGFTVAKDREDHFIRLTLTLLFRTEHAAESQMDDLEEFLDDVPQHMDIEEVREDSEFVQITIIVDEDDWEEFSP